MKKRTIITSVIAILLGVALYSQVFRGTPAQIQVAVDANGYLSVFPGAQTPPVTRIRFNNANLAVDANGYLAVNCIGCDGTGTIDGSIAATQVAFGTSANVIGGDAGLTYNSATDALTIVGTASARRVVGFMTTEPSGFTQGPIRGALSIAGEAEPVETAASVISFDIEQNIDQIDTTARWNQFNSFNINGSNHFSTAYGGENAININNTSTVTTAYATIGEVYNNDSAVISNVSALYGTINNLASGTLTTAYGSYSRLLNEDTGTVVNGSGFYVASPVKGAGATTTNYYSFYSQSVVGSATNPYYLWYSGGGADCNAGGVYRVNHFGIEAYYNPCFLEYTPNLANFERIITRWGDTGVFGTDNIAYLGVEIGGTGTNRALELIGGGLRFNSTLVTPASTGTRYLCISTAGVVTSSATACSGT